MTQHDPTVRLRHMLDHANEAIALLAGKSKSDLFADRILELALVRLIEIIGEAASRVPPNIQSVCPSVPWKDIIGMRHRLIHGYDSVDLDRLRDTIKTDLPDLIKELSRCFKD